MSIQIERSACEEYRGALWMQAIDRKIRENRRWILELRQVDSHIHFQIRNPDGAPCHGSGDQEVLMRQGDFLDLYQRLEPALVTGTQKRHITPYGRYSDTVKKLLEKHCIPMNQEGEQR